MSTPPEPAPRRGFRSRSPLTGHTTATGRGWALSRHQLSGLRFSIRRIAVAVALRDTRMLADPLRRQGRILSVGALLAVVMCIMAVLWSLWRPAGIAGTHPIVSDRTSGALYVIVDGNAHPAANLASARLIAGRPDNPTPVTAATITALPLGPAVGIYGAPNTLAQNPRTTPVWTACDTTPTSSSAPRDGGGLVVITAEPDTRGDGHAHRLDDNAAVLAADTDGALWLLWGHQRARIDPADTETTAALGITDATAARPITAGLLNTITAAPPITVPFIANPGDPPRFSWPTPDPPPPNGAVITDRDTENHTTFYVVHPDGLQRVPPLVANLLRNHNSYGLVTPPQLTPDQIAKTPAVTHIPVDDYPAGPPRLVGADTDPVLCTSWREPTGTHTAHLAIMTGQHLPAPAHATTVALPQSTTPGFGAHTAITDPNGGFYVQTTNQAAHPATGAGEPRYWITALGHRYGLHNPKTQAGGEKAAPAGTPTHPAEDALGITGNPLPIPWAFLTLLAPGPTLSKTRALTTH